ncbi:filamentous hemagglutinin N-terminal domain-containing protein [Pantoea sp. KPR_PJ]|uniref:filamentous hemagglutinin N-terminal domain-containing protein n=1 Tax=Pantoea sp. KPR_PJ TaxID=2738375 RepID=UPI00352813BF
MKRYKLNALFLATSVMLAPAVFANPSTYTHANGSTIVNINDANASGLSHNMWTDFNVSSKGMVLNNSLNDLVRESGDIAKNRNLSAPAKVILNEVISNKASQLKGALEVAGQSAEVIIANPNGITCSGCSFINASRATLTTGTPVFTDGALSSFKVQKGTVTIKGLVNAQSYTDILAETIKINGQLETGTLKAIAGKFSYDPTTGKTVADGSSSRNVGIDISALGGVTAGVIQLQTTKAGSGVNNNGILSADAIQISSNGVLNNQGKLAAKTLVASTVNKLSNSGSLEGTTIQLVSANELENSGTIRASSALATSIGQITNKGTITGSSLNQLVSYAGDITNSGTIESDGTVYLMSGYAPYSGNAYSPYANTSINNTKSGVISGTNGVNLTAVKAINLSSGSVSSAQGQAYFGASKVDNRTAVDAKNLTVYANEFVNSGTMTATGQLTATGNNSITNTGMLKGDTLTLNTKGKLNTQSCKLWVLCQSGTLSAGSTLQINASSVGSINNIGGTVHAPVLELNKTSI